MFGLVQVVVWWPHYHIPYSPRIFFAKIFASKRFRENFRCKKLFDAKSRPPKDGDRKKGKKERKKERKEERKKDGKKETKKERKKEGRKKRKKEGRKETRRKKQRVSE